MDKFNIVRMRKIISIIGARPQFIKHAPMQLELQKYFEAKTIHTGQHYDQNMSDVFFNELGMKQPDYLFDIGGSKSQGEQTGIMMTEIERVFQKEKPNAILIYGDTNSTLAGAIVAVKMNIPIIHVEAGLRSYNRAMPEEVNRIIADEFSKLLFCPTSQAIENLRKEGITHEGIFLTGDVMSDTLSLVKDKVERKVIEEYYFATLHRPYNTDDEERLIKIIDTFQGLDKKVVFAVHPRTVSRIKTFGIDINMYTNIDFIAPVGYIESVSYQSFASAIITDSGGMQKEAYMLGKKCITIRSETEWAETLIGGWNTLVFQNLSIIPEILKRSPVNYQRGLYGDGHAAKEIVNIITKNI
ncbi:UDP-GlcNAc3NAcA epimerase [Sphingobacterium sp. JUb20]|nr:UDP-GlcNAc3NAcA epimerase [Sphingobacterium sp. JUb20]